MESRSWPAWWEWALELTPHLYKRMVDRDFTEVELRQMMEQASGYRPDFIEDRYLIETTHEGRLWHMVVEPDEELRLLVVVTAYRAEEG